MVWSRPFRRPIRFRNVLWILGGGMLLVVLGGGVGLYFIPLPEGLTDPGLSSVEFQDRTGVSLRILPNPDGRMARETAESEIPLNLELATLAAEDARFQSHIGVDWRATLRALAQGVRHRRIVSGASTITQQLIKLAHPRPRTWTTKIIEAAQALKLEMVWDKSQILHAYLGRVDYGNRCQGIREAARHYFGRPPGDLTLAECALLAGLPQAPSRLNPRNHMDRAILRQQWILQRMESLGWIMPESHQAALQETLHFVPPARTFLAPHLVDLLRRDIRWQERKGAIRTTLDLRLQTDCEHILKEQLLPLAARRVGNGAIVVIDNRTDELLTLVGGRDWSEPTHGQVNAAWARRSPGSALKPFTYLLALEAGATAADMVADVPTEFPTSTGIFRPLNYDHRCHGPLRLRIALANSLNIPAVQVLNTWSSPTALRERLEKCGLTTLTRSDDDYGLGLTLGNAEVRLLELANAYAALARLGEWHPVRTILHEPGTSDAQPPHRVFSVDACWLVADILSDNAARSLAFGWNSPLRFEFPVACKTGTSSDFQDNWAFGFTPEFTVGVWVGNLDGTPMSEVSGVTGAGPILHEVMVLLHQTRGTGWFGRPPEVEERTVDSWTGHELTSGLRPSAGGGDVSDSTKESPVMEFFVPGHPPHPARAEDWDEQGRVILGAEYAEWSASPDCQIRQRINVRINDGLSPLRILSPVSGTVLFLDPDQTVSSQKLQIKANRPCRWEAEGLESVATVRQLEVDLAIGRHRILAVDPTHGERAEIWFEVRKL